MTHPDVQRLSDHAEQLASRWFRKAPVRKWKVVVGRVGTGKSHIARALHRFAMSAAYDAWGQHWGGGHLPGALFVEWLTVASPEKCDNDDWDRFILDAEAASFIILDDIGTETDQFKTGVPVQRLCHLLNRIENKYAWITTNKAPSVWQSTWDDRVEDRLLSGELVEVNAPSYRSEV